MEKRPLSIDWGTVMSKKRDEQPAELVVVPADSCKADIQALPDHELAGSIQRFQSNIRFCATLPDNGKKFRDRLECMLEEQERRRLKRLQKNTEESEKPTQSGSSDGCATPPPILSKPAKSEYQSHSSSILKRPPQTANKSDCGHLGRSNSKSWRKRRKAKSGAVTSSPGVLFRSSTCLSDAKDKTGSYYADNNGSSSKYCPPHTERSLPGGSSEKRKDAHFKALASSKLSKVQTVVLSDEEETAPGQPMEVDKSETRMKDAKIYYPSRSDPEAVELFRSDLECLEPESPLSSPIMNYYIQYLQKSKSSNDKSRGDYHFFNTYFYKKLEEAASHKGIDKGTLYGKIRRWWKGVNIFQKAYIFLPVHADLHWSLVIICIPAKEDESGPIVLHLDSLGYHPSSLIFENIESFLKEEWHHINQAGHHLDVPLSERVWQNLSRRIDRKVISVPQQKNDYDCGLFVLYFMERFIEEAPERLRRKDLSRFGSRWFQPEEASGLRHKIRRLLDVQFERIERENGGKEHEAENDSTVDSLSSDS